MTLYDIGHRHLEAVRGESSSATTPTVRSDPSGSAHTPPEPHATPALSGHVDHARLGKGRPA